jgi:SAM-dependent methyltransferase
VSGAGSPDAPVVDYADRYDPDTHVDRWYTDATAAAIARHVQPGHHVLELGCATGRMSAVLVAAGATLVGVDRSPSYLDRARDRALPGATFRSGDVESWVGRPAADDQRADHVVATNLVHELHDPVAFIRGAARWLSPGGRLHLSLQNPRSIHRLVGLATGAITDLKAVTEAGRELHTRELFDADDLSAMGRAAGLVEEGREGVMLKPVPNGVMATLPDDVLEGFVRVAPHFPEHCSMNYVRLRRP